ncbi:50S ribosomal protein L5 [Candidatus Peregrinibacteria bacterium CG10_big_fil_rev_8_21_14_0_10_36_19]|nr:MAG: 50S ribosomal protein L5 [Candidatus Peregrinibacteria bacterium CG10_big_fil_rev_8_21_14_0_10_36_19]
MSKTTTQSADLKTRFNSEILPELKKTLGIKNDMAMPKLKKVTINVGIGTYIKTHGKDFDNVVENIAKITGQKPVVAKAKKAISNFKLREDNPVGVTVTLRGQRMYDFINKLVNIVFPRVRDFRGISPKSFDGNGNYNVGFKEHTVFPEISPDDVMKLHGVEVSITTTAKNDEEGYELLKSLGFPFKTK